MEHSTNSKVLFRSLVDSITIDDSRGEIESIVFMMLRTMKGITRDEILAGKVVQCTTGDFRDQVQRINTHEPIQYILGVTEFYGREFRVDPSVLIPRPETETLVTEALRALRGIEKANVLDVGTGSGCIAITLALDSSTSKVTAIDVNDDTLGVARQNAGQLKASIDLLKHDVLEGGLPRGPWDMIVSNPPYVLRSEASTMMKNVMDFEPHLALFVPDDDPLVFYKAIASGGSKVLVPGGFLIVEINEKMGRATVDLFSKYGYSSSIVKDLDGKDRVVVARRP